MVALDAEATSAYASAKSALWDELHALRGAPLDIPAVRGGLRALARGIGARTRELHKEQPFDLFYTHDFQLLELAPELPQNVPRVFRWHVPVTSAPARTREYVAHALDGYDAVIVSTERYAEELESWGVRARIHASYPYIDETRRRVVTTADIETFAAQHGIGADDVVFTIVARMDPMKSHDVAIRALARIARLAPEAKLLLVGGGGFSGGRRGLGLTQAGDWRAHLEGLARELGVEERVRFTGGLSDDELDVAITCSRAILLPSALEGFGLAAVEGWLYGKPVLVSEGAGVAELVDEGVNGHTFAPGDDAALARTMLRLAQDADEALAMGEAGRGRARACYLDEGASAVWDVLEGVIGRGAKPPSRRSG
jgi:glycosyltransferase involved in cell wall biosynthesis